MDIIADDATLEDALDCPSNTAGLIIFTHGSGSSRSNPRGRYVADQPRTAGLGTLLFGLLSAEEAPHVSCRFDIALLVCRPQRATHVVGNIAHGHGLRLGYFGASTGAAVATLVASGLNDACTIETVINCGGRPDLTGQHALAGLVCSTLLIVSTANLDVLDLNRQALNQMYCERTLETVPHTAYLFEEAGMLEQATELARVWFVRHLSTATRSRQHAR